MIHVGASAKEIPEKLVAQLKPKTGILLIPVGLNAESPFQTLVAVSRNDNGEAQVQQICSVRFVPLGSKQTQLLSSGNYARVKTFVDQSGEKKKVLPFLMNSEPIDLKTQKWTSADDF